MPVRTGAIWLANWAAPPKMPSMTSTNAVLFDKPVNRSSLLVKPYSYVTLPVSTAEPPNTPRTSVHISAGASSTLWGA